MPGSKSPLIASPAEDLKFLRSHKCTQGVRARTKNAAIACVRAAVPTLVALRTVLWAKANISYVGQALIISSASISTYFITVDKTILACARRNTHYKTKEQKKKLPLL